MLAFSAQSFAPFAFSPLAFAIEELIEEIQAGRVNGGGKARGRPQRSATKTAEIGWKRGKSDGPSEEEVRAQWELLELRREAQRLSDAEQLPAPQPAITRETAAAPAAQAPAITSESATTPSPSHLDDEAAALLLLLAEA